jgi:hypothetical protein
VIPVRGVILHPCVNSLKLNSFSHRIGVSRYNTN